MKRKLREVILRHVKIPLSVPARTTKHTKNKIRKDIEVWTIPAATLTWHKTLYTTAEYIIFSNVCGIFAKIDYLTKQKNKSQINLEMNINKISR